MCKQKNLRSVSVAMTSLRLTELNVPDDLLQVPGDRLHLLSFSRNIFIVYMVIQSIIKLLEPLLMPEIVDLMGCCS